MAKIFAPTNPEMSEREKRNFARVRHIAAQGMVLLKNNGVLPLAADGRKLALFGNGVRRMVKGGTGSGDVNARSVTDVEQGLQDAGFEIGTTAWLDRFDQDCADCGKEYMTRFQAVLKEKGASGAFWAMDNPYRDPDVPSITARDLEGTDRRCAVYVLARTSGEGADRKQAPGDYELTQREKENLTALTGYYEHTVVVLNVGGVIDTEFLRNTPGIDAVLLMSQPGCAGGLALADVLTGKVSPDGRLAATWARAYSDYPDAEGYSYLSGDLDDSFYREGIYVGYRYFDSFNITPAYPFGFGGSYTTFALEVKDVALDGETVCIRVNVQNTGSRYAGRETVQVYLSQPQGKLDKPYQVLAGFAKTGSLAPGQCETVTVTFPLHTLASYDEEQAVWLLEKGVYYLRVGSHSRSTCIAAALELGETVVTARLQNRLQPDCPPGDAARRPGPLLHLPGGSSGESRCPPPDSGPRLHPLRNHRLQPETVAAAHRKRADRHPAGRGGRSGHAGGSGHPTDAAGTGRAGGGLRTGRFWIHLGHWGGLDRLPRRGGRNDFHPAGKPGRAESCAGGRSGRSAPFPEFCGRQPGQHHPRPGGFRLRQSGRTAGHRPAAAPGRCSGSLPVLHSHSHCHHAGPDLGPGPDGGSRGHCGR